MGCEWWRRVMRECKCDVNWIVKSIRCDVFYSTDDVVGSKMACEMRCLQ